MDPQPYPADLRNFYAHYYDRPALEIPKSLRTSISDLVASFDGFKGPSRTFLDYGFGEGLVLKAAEQRGWSVSGVELSEKSLSLGRGLGWKVAHAEEWQQSIRGPFEVVTTIETIEHVPNPLDLLRQIRQVMVKGGLLYGTTPNALSINARILKSRWSVMAAPEHIQLFSIKGLARLLERAGYTKLRLVSSGFNPADLLALATGEALAGDERVTTGYGLADSFARNRLRRTAKLAVQHGLAASQLGDTIKFWAIRG